MMLWYYDMSLRKFLQIIGLSTAGAALSGCQLKGIEPDSKQTISESCVTIPANQSVAHAVHDAGADVVVCVPSTGTAKIFDAYNKLIPQDVPYSYNEEVAYTIAHSASLNGRRSAIIIKSHGLAKAKYNILIIQQILSEKYFHLCATIYVVMYRLKNRLTKMKNSPQYAFYEI